MSERIRWTDAELALLAKEVIYKYGWPIKDGKTTLQYAVQKIQHILPLERRRNNLAAGKQAVVAVYKALDRLVGQPATTPLPPVIEVPPAPPERPPTPPAPATPGAYTPGVEDVLSTWLAGILKDTVRKLLVDGDIAKVLRNLSYNQVPDVVHTTTPKHNPEALSEPKVGKTKVLLCGVRPDQQGHYQSTFEDLHFRFYWSDKKASHNASALREKMMWADVIVFKMDATSHNDTETSKGLGKKVIKISGSTSSIMDALSTIK